MNFPTNRNSKQEKRSSTGFYCWRCDRNHVQSGGKCNLCGWKDKRKRDKK